MKVWNIIEEFYSTFGFKPKKIRLSFHDPKHLEKYLGDKGRWKIAEDILRDIAKEKGVETIDGMGEAAFTARSWTSWLKTLTAAYMASGDYPA